MFGSSMRAKYSEGRRAVTALLLQRLFRKWRNASSLLSVDFFFLVFNCLRFVSVVYFGKTAFPRSPALALMQRIWAGSQKGIWDKQGT